MTAKISAILFILTSAANSFAASSTAPIATNAVTPVAKISDLFDDPVIVRGKGIEVRRSQIEDAFITFAATLAARGQRLPDSQRPVREAQLLDTLVTTRILINRATDADRTRARELFDKFVARERRGAGSDEMFRRQLKAAGMSAQSFTNLVMDEALAQAVVERELKPKVVVTDAQIEEFYKTGTDILVREMQSDIERLEKNPRTTVGQLNEVRNKIEQLRRLNLADLEEPEKVRVSHIIISTRDKNTGDELKPDQKKSKRQLAEQLLRRIRGGEDFTKLMKEFSDDKRSLEKGGEYTITRQDQLAPEFKAAAFSLATNQISDIVTTIHGYHIIKSHEHTPSKKFEFAKIAPQLKEALTDQAMQRKMPEFFAEVKKDAAIEVLDPKYKIALPKPTDSLRPPI